MRKRMLAIHESQAQVRILCINIFEFFGPWQRICTHHHQMLQPRRAIRPEFRLCCPCDSYVNGRSARRAANWLKRDVSENTIFVGTSEVAGEYELSLDLLFVTTKRCRRK